MTLKMLRNNICISCKNMEKYVFICTYDCFPQNGFPYYDKKQLTGDEIIEAIITEYEKFWINIKDDFKIPKHMIGNIISYCHFQTRKRGRIY